MRARLVPLFLALILVSSAAHAQAHLTAYPSGETVVVSVSGASGERFALLATPDSEAPPERARWIAVGGAALCGGEGTLALDRSALAAAGPVALRALYAADDGGALAWSSRVLHPLDLEPPDLANEQPPGQIWDFDWGVGGVAQAAGAIVTQTQPWADFATLAAQSASGPDAAVLVTGPPELGLLLAVADDLVDADRDGLVDAPAGAPRGGVLTLAFPGIATVTSMTFVATAGGEVRAFLRGALQGTTPIPDLGGGGIAEIYVQGGGACDRVEIELVGGGGVGAVQLLAYPMRIGFDETTTGVPLDLEPGTVFSGKGYGGIGLFNGSVTAQNNAPGHPNKALIFDSAAPSGEDEDLATPAAGDDVAYRRVLIIAEDDVDLDGDGLVDDPDDEAAGGTITFGWVTSDIVFRSVTVLDVDDAAPSFVRVFDSLTGAPTVIPLLNLGENSVQTVTGDLRTRQIEIVLGGSGAVAELVVVQPVDF